MLLFWNLFVLHLGSTTSFGFLVFMVVSTLVNNELSFFKSFLAKLRQSCSRLIPEIDFDYCAGHIIVCEILTKDDVKCSFLYSLYI